MNRLRTVIGIAAVLLFLAGFNLLILREELFTSAVLNTFMGGLALGTLWLLLSGVNLLRRKNDASIAMLNSVVSSFVFLGICMTAYAIIEREDLSWDLTQEGRRELAPQTKLILQSLTNPVEITCFFIRSGDDRIRVAQDKTERFLRQCQRFSDRLEVEFIDPQQHPERVKALNMIRVSNVGTIVIRSGTRQREIPLSDVNARLEERTFTNTLLNVSRESIPKVYFLLGHSERDIIDDDPKHGGSNFALWLKKEAHEVGRCIISPDNPLLPEDCTVLIINGYQSDLQPHEIPALDQFIQDGGRLLILVNVQMLENNDARVQEQMRPWLNRRFGINLGSNIIVSKMAQSYEIGFVPDFEIIGGTTGAVPPDPAFRGSFNKLHPITRNLDKQVLLSFIRTVSLDEDLPEGVSGSVLMRTPPDTWAETDLQAVVSQQSISENPHEASGPNPVMVAVAARSNRPVADGDLMREARIVVLGDADLTMNEQMNSVSNQDLLLNSMAWLTETEELIAIRPTANLDQPLILSTKQQRLIAWVASLGAVQAIALIGALVYARRRRYR